MSHVLSHTTEIPVLYDIFKYKVVADRVKTQYIVIFFEKTIDKT